MNCPSCIVNKNKNYQLQLRKYLFRNRGAEYYELYCNVCDFTDRDI